MARLDDSSLRPERVDSLIWRPAASGEYTVKGGYKWWREQTARTQPSFLIYKQIWRPPVPMKIRVFLWLLFQKRLLTRVYRAKWATNAATTCVLCEVAPKTVNHLFCECAFVQGFWEELGRKTRLGIDFRNVEELWIAGKDLCRAAGMASEALYAQVVVPVEAWTIWRMRNEVIFYGARAYIENMTDAFRGMAQDCIT
ncbi:hypothetical protein QJS04_geneDACA017165 [Acorus gramineus]|uniref:Reverse transcriptase zinc-binding domain-containing protein n=1 Tax=Acorus gramineus TaxID=55184 RepID=A0AAV9BS39_ACOGR|nr:hypothetical protein QJS04_geneDACA017165 [Acorus gramineus]